MGDLASVVPLIASNLKRNTASPSRGTPVEVLPCCWDSPDDLRSLASKGPYELIVGSDLLYRLQVVDPLLEALVALTSESSTVVIAASTQHCPECIRDFYEKASKHFHIHCLGS